MIAKLIDSVITANGDDTWLSQIPPSGMRILIKKIGVSVPNSIKGFARIEWGDATGWETLATLCSTFEKDLLKEIVADGSKAIRIYRKNGSAEPTVISAWIEAQIRQV